MPRFRPPRPYLPVHGDGRRNLVGSTSAVSGPHLYSIGGQVTIDLAMARVSSRGETHRRHPLPVGVVVEPVDGGRPVKVNPLCLARRVGGRHHRQRVDRGPRAPLHRGVFVAVARASWKQPQGELFAYGLQGQSRGRHRLHTAFGMRNAASWPLAAASTQNHRSHTASSAEPGRCPDLAGERASRSLLYRCEFAETWPLSAGLAARVLHGDRTSRRCADLLADCRRATGC